MADPKFAPYSPEAHKTTESFKDVLHIPTDLFDKIMAEDSRLRQERYRDHFSLLLTRLCELKVTMDKDSFFKTSVDGEWWSLLVRPTNMSRDGHPHSVLRLMFNQQCYDIVTSEQSILTHDYFVDPISGKLAAYEGRIMGAHDADTSMTTWMVTSSSGPLVMNNRGEASIHVGCAYEREVFQNAPLNHRFNVISTLITDLMPMAPSQSEEVSGRRPPVLHS